MSTFGGFMSEFPHIRIDFFRLIEGIPPPLACFLSHVHSDHLAGLESLKSPFIYCSAATKAILLRLERYPHRINFEKGICESRKQHYKHLKRLLKPIPLHTPTCIELSPGSEIQVTLFDANHCVGSVMFLIEGGGKAVLYTGDIRAEPWFVNSLARNPCIIEYASGLKILDCIYLDTSFTDPVVAFPTKAEGLAELVQKVSMYPKSAEFHFSSWTFGYEEVWMALSRSLQTQIHVDRYKMRLYQSLRDDMNGGERVFGSPSTPEAAILAGHRVGNTDHPGILTLDHTVRLHSCERQIKCTHLGHQTVWIKPIISRTPSGQEICEIGVGGGWGDLNQRPEIELNNDMIVTQLMEYFTNRGDLSTEREIKGILLAALHSTRKSLLLDNIEPDLNQNELPLDKLVKILMKCAADQSTVEDLAPAHEGNCQLPKVITFPYSRHSSFAELRSLVALFKPADIYPCTVNKANWDEGASVRANFGDLCSENVFRHDDEMRENLSDFYLDEDEKSWNTATEPESQLGPEDENYQHQIFDDEHEASSEVQETHITIDPIDEDKKASPSSQSYGAFEQGLNNQLLCLSDKDSPPVIVRHGLRRKISMEGDYEKNPKRPCVYEINNGNGSQTFLCDVNVPILDKASQPAITGVPGVSYYDIYDSVYRCESCGCEVWGSRGGCTSCSTGERVYYEAIDSTEKETGNQAAEPKSKRRKLDHYPRTCLLPNPVENESGDTDQTKAEEATGSTGDYVEGASAYDSASNVSENEYEMNSFIDDSLSEKGNDKIADCFIYGGIESEARKEQLSFTCKSPEQDPTDPITELESRDTVQVSLVDDYGDSDDTHLEVIDLQVLHPLDSEVVISSVQDSQSSVISPRRLQARMDAFLAAPEDWHNISLMSTGDNHTEESQEL